MKGPGRWMLKMLSFWETYEGIALNTHFDGYYIPFIHYTKARETLPGAATPGNVCYGEAPYKHKQLRGPANYHPSKLKGFCNKRLTSWRKRATVAP